MKSHVTDRTKASLGRDSRRKLAKLVILAVGKALGFKWGENFVTILGLAELERRVIVLKMGR